MSSLLRNKLKINHLIKLTARYQPYNVDHSTWPKPYNVLDNVDPTRFDKGIKDEFDLAQRKFNQGDKPPLAWKATRDFPDWYRPYVINYFGHGYLILGLSFLIALIWVQHEQTKRIQGRRKLKDFRNENKRIAGFLVRNTHRKYKLTLPDPQIAYVKRYVAESGF